MKYENIRKRQPSVHRNTDLIVFNVAHGHDKMFSRRINSPVFAVITDRVSRED